MILLHHLRIGRSIFTVWQLEEFGVPYDLKVYHRDPATFKAQDDLKAVHPLGKSPVIEDGEIMLSESGAITSYLLEKFDQENKLSPPRSDLARWAKYTQWLHYPEGSVFLPLLVKMLLARSGQDHVAFTPFSEKEIKLHLEHIAAQLGDNEFILGDEFSAADFGISYVVSMAKRLGVLDPYPTLNAYQERNLSRPAYLRAIERAVE
ncbi:MAG: glutathione S-transferase [Glaciecola sp.]|jgi:glutathione S-transferase